MQAIGLPSHTALYMRDPMLFLVFQAITKRTEDILEQQRSDLANKIANAVGQLFKQ